MPKNYKNFAEAIGLLILEHKEIKRIPINERLFSWHSFVLHTPSCCSGLACFDHYDITWNNFSKNERKDGRSSMIKRNKSRSPISVPFLIVFSSSSMFLKQTVFLHQKTIFSSQFHGPVSGLWSC